MTNDTVIRPSKANHENLVAELEAAAGKWVLEKNKYTLESLRDVRRAVVAAMSPSSETGEQQPVAWMTDEDPPRVASAWTREGMHAPLQRAFCIPLYRASQKASEPQMAMLPNDHHPGPRCSCRDCQRRYPSVSEL